MKRRETTYIDCPDCETLGYMLRPCECNGTGCEKCKGEGVFATVCNTCHGKEKIPVTVDEGLDTFEDIPFAEALRLSGNRQYRREKLWT